MDYYHQNGAPEGTPHYSPRNPGMSMAMASLFLGIASIFTVASVFLPFILGGLGILLALLSKGYGKKLLTQARIGIICGVSGMILTITIIISSVTMLLQNPDLLLDFGKQYDQMFENMYGESTEDLYGTSFEDLMKNYTNMLPSKQ